MCRYYDFKAFLQLGYEKNACWRQHLTSARRPYVRLLLINRQWFPAMPMIGQKADKIYYLRFTLARLNQNIAWAQGDNS